MTSQAPDAPLRQALRSWLRPPRAHGEIIEGRTVSFLELFYDLVYVVLIAQISHTLASAPSGEATRDFVVLFALIWFAWLNGSLYHELHGGDDGRSRTYIFIQMTILCGLAVYAGHAGDTPDDGRGFAIVYTLLLVVLGWQWLDVRRHDTPDMRPLADRYLAGLAVIAALTFASALVDHDVRRVLWVVAVVLIVVAGVAQSLRTNPTTEPALRVTESMAERFGLFTIIVLGEVVVGVVDGVTESERTGEVIVTATLALFVGFGIWWNYFDFVGRRGPSPGPGARTVWVYGHLVVAAAIAATGAGMVSLIGHADDSRTPTNTAWLTAGGTAATALAIAVIAGALPADPGRRRVPVLLLGTAAVGAIIAVVHPAPWVLALALAVMLFAVWIDAFVLHARHGQPIGQP